MRVNQRLNRRDGIPIYGLALGVVMGMLIAGLAFPLAFGSRTIDPSGSPELTPGQGRAISGSDVDGDLAAGLDETTRTGSTRPSATQHGFGPGGRTATVLPPGVKLTATDVGVTKDNITVGVLIDNPEGLMAIGVDLSQFSPELVEAAYKAFFDDVNSQGGVLGRKIKPIYRQIDELSEEDKAAACREMTQDHKVFAAFNLYGVEAGAELCYTKDHRTPLFRGDASLKETFDASKGYLSTPMQNSLRLNQNLAWELHRMGVLKGKKIGVLAGSGGFDTSRADAEAMLKILRGLGYEIAHVSYISAELETAQSQIPGEVAEMKRKGVQVVPMLTGFVTNSSFAQTAEAQQFFPLYAVNDWLSNSTDTGAQAMPRSYDGAIAITSMRAGEWRTDLPEGAADRACLKTFKKSSGEEIAHSEDDARYAIGLSCEIVYRFADAAALAGAELTRDRLSGAIQALGKRDIPFTGGGSYGPGKFDGADFLRTKRFEFDCSCYVVTEDFRPNRF